MADNRNLGALVGNCACDEVTYSSDTAVVQLVRQVRVTGSEGSKVVVELVTTPYRNINLSTTGQVVKASAGLLRSVWAINLNTGALLRYVKVYDKATAATSSDTPTMTIPLMPGVPTPVNLHDCAFASGCSVRASTGVADADNTAPGANEVVVIIETI